MEPIITSAEILDAEWTPLPTLPEKIQALHDLAFNLWWTWNREGREVFEHYASFMDVPFAENPVSLLRTTASRATEILDQKEFLLLLDSAHKTFRDYLSRGGWWAAQSSRSKDLHIAFFSAEFGLHHALPIYSGGLGVLAGDFLKATSDLGIPLVGVSLLYRHGYFRQVLSSKGEQREHFPPLNVLAAPLQPAYTSDGTPVVISVQVGDRVVRLAVWQLNVGKNTLLLLDSRRPENTPEDQLLTAQLYAGGSEHRLRQEIVLGIGGVRALAALGIKPDVYHMNEGHSAFLALEQIRHFIAHHNLSTEQALAVVRAGHLFTTHTPLQAANDIFSRTLMEQYFAKHVQALGLDVETLLRLGRVDPNNHEEGFSMAVLGFRTSGSANAVSNLHGQVSRRQWQNLWAGAPVDEVPISHVTNGVHLPTWLSPRMAQVFDCYLPKHWRSEDFLGPTWSAIEEIPDGVLWEARTRSRHELVTLAQKWFTAQQRERYGAKQPPAPTELLNPEILTIGFARRFAVYKRANLLFRDLDRLKAIVLNAARPVQFIFAGKAHPADMGGKELIRQLLSIIESHSMEHRVIFLANYNMALARHLVQGVDVWLNNPRRPLEASGTSGMKAAMNGALNVSILDGWWCEAFDGFNGWSIGNGEEYPDHHYQDEIESGALYSVLEEQVVPAFYERDENGLPRNWIWKMKHSIKSIAPQFTASRMAIEYATRFYLPHALTRQTQA